MASEKLIPLPHRTVLNRLKLIDNSGTARLRGIRGLETLGYIQYW